MSEPIDLEPLDKVMRAAEMSLHHAVTIYLQGLDCGWSPQLDSVRAKCAAADAAEKAWSDAVEHNGELHRQREAAEPPLFANPDGPRLVPGDNA